MSCGALRIRLVALVLAVTGCGKFQQARECAAFVKTVNTWLASPGAKIADADADEDADAGTGAATDPPKQVAAEARRTAQHYSELSQSLTALHVQGEELAPRVKRYEALADEAARTLLEVAHALDQGDLEKARKKRVDFDAVAQSEAPLVREINGVCR